MCLPKNTKSSHFHLNCNSCTNSIYAQQEEENTRTKSNPSLKLLKL